MLKYNVPIGKIPKELETLFMLYKTMPTPLPNPLCQLDWIILDVNDNKINGDILLSRKSFFHQVRKFVWDMELYYNNPLSDIKHFITEEHIDLQLSYSENTLDWVFSKFSPNNRLANIKKLERLIFANIPSKYNLKLPVTPIVVAPPVVIQPLPQDRINSPPRAEFVPSITSVRPQSGSRSPRPVSSSRPKSKSNNMNNNNMNNNNNNMNNNMNNNNPKDLLSVDDIVEIRYKTSSDWFQGKITKISNIDENGVFLYDVLYDDGDKEMMIRRNKVRRFGETQTEILALNETVDAFCSTVVSNGILNQKSSCLPGIVKDIYDDNNYCIMFDLGNVGLTGQIVEETLNRSFIISLHGAKQVVLPPPNKECVKTMKTRMTLLTKFEDDDEEKEKSKPLLIKSPENKVNHGKIIFEVGDVIESYRGKGIWGAGTITGVYGNDTYDVQYDDGENEICQDNDLIRFAAKIDKIQEKEGSTNDNKEEECVLGSPIKVNGVTSENKGIVESVIGGVISIFGGSTKQEKEKEIIPLIEENKPEITNEIPINNQPIIDNNNNQESFNSSNSPRELDSHDMTRVDSVEGFIINDDNEDDYGEDFECGEDEFENYGEIVNSDKNRKHSGSSEEGIDMNDFIKNM
jgi:hypothetical protein